MTSPSEIQLGAPAPSAAIVALVALMAAILTTVVRSRPQESSSPPPPQLTRVAADHAVEPPTGSILIDAIPWGRIERIETPEGERLEPPEPRETPVLLRIPAGTWRVAISNPTFDEERVCEFDLAEGTRQDCRVEFERLSVDQYFREAGWWR